MSVITPTSTTFVEDSHLIELFGISELGSAVSTTHHIQNTLNLKYRSSRVPPAVVGGRNRGGGAGPAASTFRRAVTKKPEPIAENDNADATSSGVVDGEEEETEMEDGEAEEKEEEERREKLRLLRQDALALSEALHVHVNDRCLTESLLRVCHRDDQDGVGEEDDLHDNVVCYDWLEAMRGWRRVMPFARYVYVSPAVGGKKKKKHSSSSHHQQQQQLQQPAPTQKVECDIIMPYVLPLESDVNFPPKPKAKSAKRGGMGGGGRGGDGGEDDTDRDSPDSNGEESKQPQQPFPSPRETVGVPHYMRDTYLSRYHRLQREREREREREYKEREEKLRMHYLKDDEGKWRVGSEKAGAKSSKEGKDDSSQHNAQPQQRSKNEGATNPEEVAAKKPPPEAKKPRQVLPIVEGKAKLAVQTFPLEGQQSKDDETKDETEADEKKSGEEKKRDKKGAKPVAKVPGISTTNATIYSSSSPAGIMDVPKASPKPLKGRNVEIDIAQPKGESPSFPGGISKFVANNSKIHVRKERFSKMAPSSTFEMERTHEESAAARKFRQDEQLWQVPIGDFGPSVVRPAMKHFIDLPDSTAEGGRADSTKDKTASRLPSTVLSKSLLMGPSSLVLENLIPVLDREIEKDLELRRNGTGGGAQLKKKVTFGSNCKDLSKYSGSGNEYDKWSARESMDSNDSGIESCISCFGAGEDNALKPLEKVTPSQRHRKENNLATYKNHEFIQTPQKLVTAHSTVSAPLIKSKSTDLGPQKISLFSQLPIATVYNFDAADSSSVISLAGTGCVQTKRDAPTPKGASQTIIQGQFSKVSFKMNSFPEEEEIKDSVKRRKSIAFPLQTLNDSPHHYSAPSPAAKSVKKSLFPNMSHFRSTLVAEKQNSKNDGTKTCVEPRRCHLPLTEGISGISLRETSDKSHSAEFLPTISGKHLHAL